MQIYYIGNKQHMKDSVVLRDARLVKLVTCLFLGGCFKIHMEAMMHAFYDVYGSVDKST